MVGDREMGVGVVWEVWEVWDTEWRRLCLEDEPSEQTGVCLTKWMR